MDFSVYWSFLYLLIAAAAICAAFCARCFTMERFDIWLDGYVPIFCGVFWFTLPLYAGYLAAVWFLRIRKEDAY